MSNTTIRPCQCVHCNKTFYGPEEGLGGALIVGEAAQRRAMRYVQTLTTHLQKQHPQVLTTAQIFGSEYAGMLALMNFKTDDELVAQQRDFVRWKVHNATRRASVSDDRIVEKVRSILTGYLINDPERDNSRGHDGDARRTRRTRPLYRNAHDPGRSTPKRAVGAPNRRQIESVRRSRTHASDA
jgi:hypothetical protein